MANIKKLTMQWQEQGLLSHEQREKIIDYENRKPGTAWVLYGFLTLGVLVVGIGIIALIAANWDLIPKTVKLCNDFVIVAGLSFYTYWLSQRCSKIAYESVLFFLLLMILASIGLITQIYQLGGEPYQAILMYCLMTAPLVCTANFSWVPLYWTGLLIIFGNQAWMDYIDINGWGSPNYYLIPLFSGLLICVIASRVLHWFLATRSLAEGFKHWVLPYGLIVILAMDLANGESRNFSHTLTSTPLLFSATVNLVLTIAVAAGIALTPLLSSTRKALYSLLLLIYFCYEILGIVGQHIPSVVPASLTIILLGLIALHFVVIEKPRMFSLLISLIGLRFLIIYFQVFGSLARTGVGLIISGLVIIVGATLIAKNTDRIRRFAQEMLK